MLLTIFAWFIAIALGVPAVFILTGAIVIVWFQMFKLVALLFRRRRTYISFE